MAAAASPLSLTSFSLDEPVEVPFFTKSRSVRFDPAVHLVRDAPVKQHLLSDLGISSEAGVSRVGLTDPFRLFTDDAIREMRREILQPEMANYTYRTSIGLHQVREYPQQLAPFIHAAWRHQQTIETISRAMGVSLKIIMDLEIGHVNFDREALKRVHELGPEPTPPWPKVEETLEEVNPEGDVPVKWHHDSYPVVCVLMLSSTETMQGGETAVECGDGTIRKFRGPSFGYASMMQGRLLRHMACCCSNAPERISMVTSFRAAAPLIRDDSVLTTIRPMSLAPRLNYQWTMYRLEVLEERLRLAREALLAKRGIVGEDGVVVDPEEVRCFVEHSVQYLMTTLNELKV